MNPKRFCKAALFAATVLMLAVFSSCAMFRDDATDYYVGMRVFIGGYEWRVLEIRADDTMLVITDEVIELHRFHDTDAWETEIWEYSDIRYYLNGVFLDSFDETLRARVVPRLLFNRDEYDTEDYVFLLSIDELNAFFNTLRLYERNEDFEEEFPYIVPDKVALRVAEGLPRDWWLRTTMSGLDGVMTFFVDENGFVELGPLQNEYRGLRPAMWITLS